MVDKLNKRNILIVSLACAVLGLLLMFAPFLSSSVSGGGASVTAWVSGFALAFGLNAHSSASYGGESETIDAPLGKLYIGFLMIFLILLVVIALIAFLLYKDDEEQKVPVFILNILMFVLMIMTFCSPAMVEAGGEMGLGWGAIIAAILYLASFLLLSYQSYTMVSNGSYVAPRRVTNTVHQAPAAPKEKTEEDKIKDLKKMLDDGLITEDQFNRKREVILFGKEPDKE